MEIKASGRSFLSHPCAAAPREQDEESVGLVLSPCLLPYSAALLLLPPSSPCLPPFTLVSSPFPSRWPRAS